MIVCHWFDTLPPLSSSISPYILDPLFTGEDILAVKIDEISFNEDATSVFLLKERKPAHFRKCNWRRTWTRQFCGQSPINEVVGIKIWTGHWIIRIQTREWKQWTYCSMSEGPDNRHACSYTCSYTSTRKPYEVIQKMEWGAKRKRKPWKESQQRSHDEDEHRRHSRTWDEDECRRHRRRSLSSSSSNWSDWWWKDEKHKRKHHKYLKISS